jgi:hypothetical protein
MVRDEPALVGPHGVVGVDVAERTIDGRPWTVVQLLLDDDHPLFDRTLLDAPVVAEVVDREGVVIAVEPFDHDRFRRRLHQERLDATSTTRGVLVLTGGELPPHYIRLAFVPADQTSIAGGRLIVRRTTVAELVAGVESAFAAGEITDEDRRALLTSIEQRHPTSPA